jgi:hypothetical protein
MNRPLDYAPPPTSSSAITSIPLTIGLAIPTALVCILGVFVLPRMEMIFRDFKTQLPVATKIALAIGRWIASDFGWLLIWALPALVPILVTQVVPPDRSRLPRPVAMLLGVHIAWPLCALVVVAFVAGVFGPLWSLIQSVNGPGK